MIEFTGYLTYSDNVYQNDKMNLIHFIKDCQRLFSSFFDKDSENRFDFIGPQFRKSYEGFDKDIDFAIIETNRKFDEDVNKIGRSLDGPENSWNRFSNSRIRAVGLSGISLKTKLDTNKTAWDNFNKKYVETTFRNDSKKEDTISLIDYVCSILCSLMEAWKIGEIGKELLDLFKIILSRIVTN